VFNVGQLPIAWGYAGAMGGMRVYVYGLLHRSGFVSGPLFFVLKRTFYS